jgi:hypothetical protein
MVIYFLLKYVRLYIACRNLMVNLDEQHDLPTQTQNKTGKLCITVTLWCGCVTNVDVEKKYVVLILSVCL